MTDFLFDGPEDAPRRLLLAHGDAMSNDAEEFALLKPRLERWLADGASARAEQRLIDAYAGAMRYTVDHWDEMDPAGRRDLYFVQLVMRQVVRSLDRPNAIFGSVRQLKQDIDADLRAAAMLLSAIPIIALLVAAIGVANCCQPVSPESVSTTFASTLNVNSSAFSWLSTLYQKCSVPAGNVSTYRIAAVSPSPIA